MITFTGTLRATVAIFANELFDFFLGHGSRGHWEDVLTLWTDNRLEETGYAFKLPQENESEGRYGNGPKKRFKHDNTYWGQVQKEQRDWRR
ncbi:MAG TPA: hypothetical protein PLY87_22325 [Planctomycetaceae bacterium]|nr:hypothetical protein [Planctomycetaceae bacterium]